MRVRIFHLELPIINQKREIEAQTIAIPADAAFALLVGLRSILETDGDLSRVETGSIGVVRTASFVAVNHSSFFVRAMDRE